MTKNIVNEVLPEQEIHQIGDLGPIYHSLISDSYFPPKEVKIYSDIQRKIIVPKRGETAEHNFQEKFIKPDGGRFDLTTTDVSLPVFSHVPTYFKDWKEKPLH